MSLTARQRDAVHGAIVDARYRLDRLKRELDGRLERNLGVDDYPRWITEAEGDIKALSSILDEP